MTPQVTFLPDRKTIQVRPGTTLLDASRRARVIVRTRCGGNASCLMCKVIVEDQSGLSPVNDNERQKLGDLQLQNVRLACQAKVLHNTVVSLPEDPLKAAVRRLMAEAEDDQDWKG